MCYNCGCGLKDDDMKKGHVHEGGGSLTEKSFEYMAKKWGMSLEDTKRETLRMLKRELEDK
jgi:hypothetical protein